MGQNTLNLNGSIYVRISFLTEYGLSQASLKNRLNQYRKGETKNYAHFDDSCDRRIKWIQYSSIPVITMRRHNLPIEEKILLDMNGVDANKGEKIVRQSLQHAIEFGYIHYAKHYMNDFCDKDVIEEYAKTHAVLHACLDLKRFDIQIKDIFKVYKELEGLTFSGKSLKSFYHKLNDFNFRGSSSLVHASRGVMKSKSKLNDQQLDKIESLFRDPRQMSGSEMLERLNYWSIKREYKIVSISTLRRVISSAVFQNTNRKYRNGEEWVKNNFQPFQLRNSAEYQGEQWQIDGTRLQIPYLNITTNRPSFLHLFVVLDTHSRKIVGYSLDKSENHMMIKSALRMAVEKCGYLPKQVLRDNASCFKQEKLKKLEKYIIYLGSDIRAHKVANARDKAQVERFFGVFQSKILKLEDGYIGEGIKSKRAEARPSDVILKKNFNPKNLKTKKELEELVPTLLEKYNNLKSLKDKLSPTLRFEIAEKCKKITPVSENHYKLMFWEFKTKVIKNSTIILSEGSHRNKEFQYIINDEQLRLTLNGIEVLVYYNRKDRAFISVFDKNEKFITDLKLSNKPKIVREYKNKDRQESSLRKKVVKKKANNSKNKLFKKPLDLNVLLVKTKDNE